MLSERSKPPRSKKDEELIKQAILLGTNIQKAYKEEGKLDKLERATRVLERTLQQRSTRSKVHTTSKNDGIASSCVLERRGPEHSFQMRTRQNSLPTKRKRQEEAKNKQPVAKEPPDEKEETGIKNKSKRRMVSSRPTSVNCVKDQNVQAKFAVVSKHLRKLQYCSTWEKKIDHDEKPKSQHFMFTYDEMVRGQKPHCSKNSRIKRAETSSIILPRRFVN